MALPVLRRDNGSTQRREEMPAWGPFAELDRFNRELSSMLESWRSFPRLLDEVFTPVADVEETADAYLVEIELPGVKKDDLHIEIAGRRLTVSGERKERERVGVLRKRERTVGRFHYEVTVPGDIDDGAVVANLDAGVLTVRLPKPERERPRRIAVQ